MNKLCLSIRLAKVILISSFSFASLSLAADINDSDFLRIVSEDSQGRRYVTYMGKNAQVLLAKHPEISEAFRAFQRKASQAAAEKADKSDNEAK